MGYCVTTPEREKVRQKKLTCTQKTASREIFSYCVKTSQEKRSQAPELHQANHLTTTKIASGIPYWPGRDPLGDLEFFVKYLRSQVRMLSSKKKVEVFTSLINESTKNLHGFVDNSPLGSYDKYGLARTKSITCVKGAERLGLCDYDCSCGPGWTPALAFRLACCDQPQDQTCVKYGAADYILGGIVVAIVLAEPTPFGEMILIGAGGGALLGL